MYIHVSDQKNPLTLLIFRFRRLWVTHFLLYFPVHTIAVFEAILVKNV